MSAPEEVDCDHVAVTCDGCGEECLEYRQDERGRACVCCLWDWLQAAEAREIVAAAQLQAVADVLGRGRMADADGYHYEAVKALLAEVQP